MIVGDSQTGWVRNFNTIYYVLKQMLSGKMRFLPIRPDTRLNIVLADWTADAVEKIAFSPEAEGKTFHLTCPKALSPAAGELAEYVRAWAGCNLSVSVPKPVFCSFPLLKRAGLAYNKRKTAVPKTPCTTA